MSNFNQPFPPGGGPQLQRRESADFRANGAPATAMSGNGVPMPVGGHASRNSAGQFPYPAMGGFAGPRSPPKTKNTSHVPCKFYPYGTCQAGAACQFSHDLDPTTQNAPCKYFTKGSCKFGQNCALAHILPDGRVINRPPRGQQFAYGRRMNGQNNLPPMPQSSLISMQANDPLAQQALEYEMAKEGQLSPRFGPTTSNIPKLDTSYIPDPIGSNYGSPLNESRLAASPVQRGLSVLDAPLPSSFDSQGISHAARHGPLAASMPPRFGIESPPSSLPNKALLGNTALRDLHDSAFGDRKLDGVLHGLGSSPPTFEESSSFNKRSLHSERFARHKMLSASLGARQGSFFPMDTSSTEESDDETPGEDLLPSSLHDLLPQEKLRRFSRINVEDENNPTFLSVQRRAISGGPTPQDSKVGSLSPHSASPSRYSAFWGTRNASKPEINGDLGGTSAFGHVGSPLRPSTLRTSSLTTGLSSSPGHVGSPIRTSGVSMLSQELQRSRISDSVPARPSPSSLAPGAERTASNGSLNPSTSMGSMSTATRNGLGERHISTNSLSREAIEEEVEQPMFSMDHDDTSMPLTSSEETLRPERKASRGRIPAWGSFGKSEATLGPIGGQRGSK